MFQTCLFEVAVHPERDQRRSPIVASLHPLGVAKVSVLTAAECAVTRMAPKKEAIQERTSFVAALLADNFNQATPLWVNRRKLEGLRCAGV